MRTVELCIIAIPTSLLVYQSTEVTGVYKLMDISTDAIKELALLDILFYVPSILIHSINEMDNTLGAFNGEIDNEQEP